jgi:subtilisin-like proprotein convertase family protein
LITGFRFGIAQLIGERADGVWRLAVQDTKKNSPADVLGWSIRAMGF